jgi:hypothetical protein
VGICPWYRDNIECTNALDGRCFWLIENGSSGSCVEKDGLVCGDLLLKSQCDGDNVPSTLVDECFLLEGNNSESSYRKQNECVLKVCEEKMRKSEWMWEYINMEKNKTKY